MSFLQKLKDIVIAINIFFIIVMYIESYNLPLTSIAIVLTDTLQFDINTNIWALTGSVVVIMSLTSLAGIQIFGSGLSDESIVMFRQIASRLIIWCLSTLATYYILSDLPAKFINMIVAIFTLLYAMGFVDEFRNGGSSE